jgi:DNA-binding CsgD family transcriptional regulator
MTVRHGTDLHVRSQGTVHVPDALIHCWEKLNEPCGVKDLHSRFVYANPAYLDLLALPKNFDITGRLDSEIPASTSEFAEAFQIHDRLVEAERQRKSSLEIHPFGHNRQIQAYFFDKLPFYSDDGEVVGTTFYGRRAEHLPLTFYTQQFSGENLSLMLTKPAEMFTDYEWKIIFYLCQGKTQKYISSLFGVSIKSVNKKVQIIYQKISVSSATELMEFCTEMGWKNYIPESLLALGHMLL